MQHLRARGSPPPSRMGTSERMPDRTSGKPVGMSGDQRVDELFRLFPDEFTSARDDLAKRLRAAGDTDLAAEVKALRRPTLAAWALNQLARQEREGLQRLRESGDALARQQRRVLSGLPPSGLRAAQEARRELTEQLLARAVAVLREAGVAPDPHADAVRGALDAAALDADAGQELLEGRLSRPLEPPSGFPALSALTLEPSDEDPPHQGGTTQSQRLAEARARLQAAQDEACSRRAEAHTAAEDTRRAADGIRRLERELSEAQQRHAAAEQRSRAAQEDADAATATVTRRQDEVARAEADAATES